MNKSIKKIALVLLALFISSTMLVAEDMNEDIDLDFDAGSIYIRGSEESGTVTQDHDIEDDYFFGGQRVEFKGSGDDLYLFGETIDYSGTSTGSILACSNTLNISGVVGQNFHGGANTVNITGKIMETAFIGANTIVIGPEAVIDGTLIVGCNIINIYGELNNGLLAAAAEVIIDGPVNGDVNVKVGKLVITERGSINGNLKYDSERELSESEKGRISGSIEYDKSDMRGDDIAKGIGAGLVGFFIIAKIIAFISLIVAGLLILLLPGVKSVITEKRNRKSYGKILLWGLIPLCIYPVVVLVTIPLFPISIALGLAVFPLIAVTTILGLALTGQFLFGLFKWKNENVFLQFLFAYGIYVVLSIIPVIGVLSAIALAAAGSGLIISKLFKVKF